MLHRSALRSPIIHVLVGIVFLALFTWPFLAFEQPINTWVFLYGSWMVAIACAFVLTQGSGGPASETDEGEE